MKAIAGMEINACPGNDGMPTEYFKNKGKN